MRAIVPRVTDTLISPGGQVVTGAIDTVFTARIARAVGCKCVCVCVCVCMCVCVCVCVCVYTCTCVYDSQPSFLCSVKNVL